MAVEELVGRVPDGWEYTTLGGVCELGGGDIQTGPFGSQLHAADYVPVGIPSIMPQDIGDNRIVEDSIARITVEDARRLSRYLVHKGDIVCSRRGDVERRAWVRGYEDGWLCGTGCLRVRLGEAGSDSRYAFYYLGHPSVREWIVRHAHGATMPNLNTSILAACPFVVPPPNEQRAIAHILGTLDDKIELNRRMNETLEAMARALFKSWFVDFDPVRAKCRGEPMCSPQFGQVPHSGHAPKSDQVPHSGQARRPAPTEWPQHILDLFPDRFVDSEFGEIPEGWEVASLPDVIEVNPTRTLRKGDVAPYLGMANMPTRGHSPDVVADRPFGSGMRFMNGDTLVARITPCLENGKTAYVDFLDDGQVGWGSTEYIVLRPRAPLPTEFAYCLARDSDFREFAIQSMTGSSGRQRVPAESLAHFQVVTAPKPIAEAFGQLIKPLFARASSATRESRALAALRDTLLPKLLSGELRVKDEEEWVEEVKK